MNRVSPILELLIVFLPTIFQEWNKREGLMAVLSILCVCLNTRPIFSFDPFLVSRSWERSFAKNDQKAKLNCLLSVCGSDVFDQPQVCVCLERSIIAPSRQQTLHDVTRRPPPHRVCAELVIKRAAQWTNKDFHQLTAHVHSLDLTPGRATNWEWSNALLCLRSTCLRMKPRWSERVLSIIRSKKKPLSVVSIFEKSTCSFGLVRNL